MREAGTDRVRRWLATGQPAISRLAEVEVAAALMRRWREGAFDQVDRDRALFALAQDLDAMSVVEIVPKVTARARALLQDHVLRAGAAIQLACCLQLREALGGKLSFVAFDDGLNEAARAVGLRPPARKH